MKIKTSELQGAPLDWAVARCEVLPDHGQRDMEDGYHPSTDWAQGGPIIERGGMSINKRHIHPDGFYWVASVGRTMEGPTPLIAAMRCFVASKLGDEVDVPDELIKQTIEV